MSLPAFALSLPIPITLLHFRRRCTVYYLKYHSSFIHFPPVKSWRREVLLRPNTSRSTDLGLLFVVLIWGLSPSIFKIAFTELEPLAFVFVRFLLLCALSLVVLFVRGRRGGKAWRISRADVPLLIVSGLSGYGFYQLF